MNSRTAGAPSTPVATEEEMTLERLQAALDEGLISPEQFAASVSSMRGRVAGEGARMGDSGPAAAAANRQWESAPPPAGAGMRTDAELRARLRDMGSGPAARDAFVQEGVDEAMQMVAAMDERVAQRQAATLAERERAAAERELQLARAGTEPMSELERKGERLRADTARRVAEAQEASNARAYGTPAGGGAAFQSEGEVAEYNRRRVMSPGERVQHSLRGVPTGVIVDAQRSQADRDMAKSGMSGGSGWAPVFTESGGVQYMERARDFQRDSVEELGMTNAVEGNRRTGPRVDAGEVSPSLERGDLQRRGYEVRTMQGPYGPERVWVKSTIGNELSDKLAAEGDVAGSEMTLADYQQRQRVNNMRDRLIVRAGLSDAEAAGMSVDQIRRLGDRSRGRDKADQAEVNRRARMAAPYRRELAFSEMPEDWRNAVAAETLAPGLEGITPLQRDAQSMQNLLRMMNMEALAGADPLNRDLRQRQMDEAERESNPAAAGQRDLRAGEFFSPQATAAVAAMAAMFDEDWGGFSEQSERRLSQYLQDNYNVPQPDAERLANVAANGRRRWWMRRAPADAGATERPVPSAPVPRGSFRD